MAAYANEDESKQLTQKIENLSINNDVILTICANCGKQGTDLNVCNKCDLAAYCNAACKKKHRTKHKKKCERRAAELYDIKLFKQPPPDDCPICMLRLPSLFTGYKYKSCCGKIICSGCIYAVAKRDGGIGLCPFCRSPKPTTNEETIEQINNRIEVGDAEAIRNLGCCYANGLRGLPQDYNKALELWHRAGELGYATAYYSIGNAYYFGRGVERNEKKAIHYYELASMVGDTDARYNLGNTEGRKGNMDRAVKHFMIAAGSGCTGSLEMIKQMFMDGDATKDDYAKALRVYQANLVEIKSPQRDEAAAFDDIQFKYY